MSERRDESNLPPRRADNDLPGGLAPPVHDAPCAQQAVWLALAERLLGTGFLSWDPAHDRMLWSDGLYALLGYERAVEPSYQNFVTAIHPLDRPGLLVRLEHALDSGTGFSLDARLSHDGEIGAVRMVAEIAGDMHSHMSRLDAVFERAPPFARVPSTGDGGRTVPSAELDTELARATIDATTDVIFAFDRTCRYLLWNKAAERLTGKPSAEVVGADAFTLFPFLKELGVDVYYRRALAGESASRDGWQILIPELGIHGCYDVSFTPLRSPGGVIIGGLGVLHDVTAQKRAEESLRLREQEFETIAETSPDIIAQLDRGHRFIYVNRRVETITGRPRFHLIGKTHVELGLASDQAERWDALLRQAFSEGTKGTEEFVLSDQHGTQRIFEWCVVPERTEQGVVVTALAIARDMTERKRMEEALRCREQEFRTLAESVPDVITRFDRNLTLLYVNRATERHVGDAPEDFIKTQGDKRAPRGTPRNLWNTVMPQVFASGQPATVEFFVPTETGARAFETRIIPENADGGPVQTVITVSRDITERKKTEDQLRHANRQLKHAMDELRASQQQFIQTEKLSALGTLAAGIAHELNNPMMGVMNYVDYARRVAGEPTAREMLGRASRELERMRDLLMNMLAFTRPTDEPAKQVSLDSVIHIALSLLATEFRAHHIDVVVDLDEDIPSLVVRERQLQQVFVNVLMNARDALEASDIRRVRIQARREAGDVLVEFTDTGPGIPPEIRNKIFDPFFTTKPPGRGTGLGLSISRSIMLELGGDLRYRNAEEGGTTLSVRVPLEPPHGNLQP